MRMAFSRRVNIRTTPVTTLAAVIPVACHNVKLTPQAESVRVIRDAAQVSRCRFVHDVESSDRLSGGLINRELAEENAYRILKQQTARLGANTVLSSGSTSGLQGAAMKGKAYACS